MDGFFGSQTENAVRRFQEIFGLTPDGVVGRATWYALVRLYVGVTSLAELRSQGQQFYNISWNYGGALQQGSQGQEVRQLQYMLLVLSSVIPAFPPVEVDGIFGPATRASVLAAQRFFGLPLSGAVDEQTWLRLESQFLTQVTDCVAEHGRCAAVVPGGLLNRTAAEDVELRKRFVEEFHVEQVILLPISAFLPYAEVRTGIFIFAKEKGDGMTRFYDLRKVEPEKLKSLPEIYRKSGPVCTLNRTILSQHQYKLSTQD